MNRKHRKDLSKHDENDLEDLKSSLTESLEKFEEALDLSDVFKPFNQSVRDRVNWFDSRARATKSQSEPSSPTKNFKYNLPIRKISVSDFSQIEPLTFKMTLSDLDPLKRVRQGHKSWVTRNINLAHKYNADGKLTLTILTKLENEINGYINKIKENEEQISLVYDQNHVDLEDSLRVADMDATANFIFDSQVTLAEYED